MNEMFKLIGVYSDIIALQRKTITTLQEANTQNQELIDGYKLVIKHFIRHIGILIEALEAGATADKEKLVVVKEEFETIKGLLNEIWEQ